jgi:GAGA factor
VSADSSRESGRPLRPPSSAAAGVEGPEGSRKAVGEGNGLLQSPGNASIVMPIPAGHIGLAGKAVGASPMVVHAADVVGPQETGGRDAVGAREPAAQNGKCGTAEQAWQAEAWPRDGEDAGKSTVRVVQTDKESSPPRPARTKRVAAHIRGAVKATCIAEAHQQARAGQAGEAAETRTAPVEQSEAAVRPPRPAKLVSNQKQAAADISSPGKAARVDARPPLGRSPTRLNGRLKQDAGPVSAMGPLMSPPRKASSGGRATQYPSDSPAICPLCLIEISKQRNLKRHMETCRRKSKSLPEMPGCDIRAALRQSLVPLGSPTAPAITASPACAPGSTLFPAAATDSATRRPKTPIAGPLRGLPGEAPTGTAGRAGAGGSPAEDSQEVDIEGAAQQAPLDSLQLERVISRGGLPPSRQALCTSPGSNMHRARFASVNALQRGLPVVVWSPGAGSPPVPLPSSPLNHASSGELRDATAVIENLVRGPLPAADGPRDESRGRTKTPEVCTAAPPPLSAPRRFAAADVGVSCMAIETEDTKMGGPRKTGFRIIEKDCLV